MNDRYFGKVVSIKDEYELVINRGSSHGVSSGETFLVVGIGDIIIDPDTQEELERLELVRGKVKVIHVQHKISTVRSCEYMKDSDIREIKKVSSPSHKTGFLSLISTPETVTESIKPGSSHLKKLNRAEIGDLLIRI